MNTELTSETLRKLAYRQMRLTDRLRQIESILSGRNGSLLRLVRDENDRYDEGRAQALVGRLLEAFRTYLRLSGDEQSMVSALTPEDEALYRSFLYCAVRYVECPPRWDDGWFDQRPLFETRGTYEDLLMLARKLTPMEKARLHYYEFYEPYAIQGFFGCMDGLYEQLTGSSIQKTVSDADQLVMRETYRQEAAVWESLAGMEAPDWDDELWEDRDLTPEEIAAMEAEENQWEEDRRRNEQALSEWLAAFREKEAFCRQYLRLREVYFDAPARGTLVQDVEHMLEILLLQGGESNYLDDELFFGALTLLDQAAGSVRRRLSSGR